MLLSDLVVQFVTHLREETTFARTTVKTYGANLRYVLRWMDTHFRRPATLSDYVPQTLVAFLKWAEIKPTANSAGLAGRTRRGYANACRAFSKWLIARELLTDCPTSGLKMPTKGQAFRPRPTEDEMDKLVEGADLISPPWLKLMGKAMLSVFCKAGLRRHEVLALTVADFHFGRKPDDNFLRVRGKGDKERTVTLLPKTVEALRTWLDFRKQMRPEHPYLFLADRKRRAGIRVMNRIIDAACAASQMERSKALNPHAFRRGYITMLSRRRVPLKEIQEQVGHSSITVTNDYIGDDTSERARIITEAFDPPAATPAPNKPKSRLKQWRKKPKTD